MAALSVAALAAFGSLVTASPFDNHLENALLPRQMNPDSTCQVFGLAFQNGGAFFLSNTSTQTFTAIYQFQGCNNDTANVILVNSDNGDQYDCADIPTVPDNTTYQSVCPVQHRQLVTGNYTLVTIGNNGNGNPFAVQRDFVLNVGQQQTSTVTSVVPRTVTSQPTVTVTVVSTVTATSTIQPRPTGTASQQVRPTSITTQVELFTRTFTRWTETGSTTTHVVQKANCYVTPKAEDKPCTTLPPGIAAPPGLRVQSRDLAAVEAGHALHKRQPDPMTVTVTTTVAGSTVTVTGQPTTTKDVQRTTQTALTTLTGSQAGPKVAVETKKVESYVVKYVTKTMTVPWWEYLTVTPSGPPTPCNAVASRSALPGQRL